MTGFYAPDWGLQYNHSYLPEITTKRDKKTLLKNLNLLAQSRPDLVDVKTDNEFLERFLRARKYDFDDSCDLFINYYTFRQRNFDIFNRLNGQDVLIQQALRDGFPGVLEKRDRRGRCVLIFIASRWNSSCYSLFTIFRSLLLSLEFLIAEEINQHKGFVFVIDWTEFTFKQSSNLTPKVLKLMIEGLQDCFPAKFKGVHFIGQPWYVEVALAFIKPFLKEKSKERIHLHGNNLGTLHQHIAKDILPSELGGEGPPFNPLPWAEKLMRQSLEEGIFQSDKFLGRWFILEKFKYKVLGRLLGGACWKCRRSELQYEEGKGSVGFPVVWLKQ